MLYEVITNRVLERPAALDPVGSRDPHADGHTLRQGGADRFDDRQRKAHAVIEGAAELVFPSIADRRQTLVQQVAVCGVNLVV